MTLASLVAKNVSSTLGGMLLAFPFLISTGLLFAVPSGATHFRGVAFGVLLGILPLLAFALTVVVAASRVSPLAALALGIASWVALSGGMLLVRNL